MDGEEAKVSAKPAKNLLETLPYLAPGFVLSLSLSNYFEILYKFYSTLMGTSGENISNAAHIKLSFITLFAVVALGIISASGGELVKFIIRIFQYQLIWKKSKYQYLILFKHIYFSDPFRLDYARTFSQKISYVTSMAFALLINTISAYLHQEPISRVCILFYFA